MHVNTDTWELQYEAVRVSCDSGEPLVTENPNIRTLKSRPLRCDSNIVLLRHASLINRGARASSRKPRIVTAAHLEPLEKKIVVTVALCVAHAEVDRSSSSNG
jgi:hypothetical protein